MTDNKTIMFTLEEIGEILGAVTEGAPGSRRIPVTGVKIDSRQIESGDLFVAIKGQNHDGHTFVNAAFENGAVAAVVSKSEKSHMNFINDNLLYVDDTVFALGEIAGNFRNRMPAEVIAITGSNGKTTVKNMIYEILSRKASTIKSQGNFNNLFGLPLSIFQLEKDNEYAVFELGMSRAGEISRLAEIASPDIAVITNVGPVHLEFFKDTQEIASAKLEILERIKPGGALVLNGDDELLRGAGERENLEVIKFGLAYSNDICPSDLEFDDNQLPVFKIRDTEFNLKFPGIHNVYNAVAAFSVAIAEGIDTSTIADVLNNLRPEAMRSQVFHRSGISFFIDCYNANPVSMKYAIDTLSLMDCGGRRIAVLGDMLELGESSGYYHKEIGKHAEKAGINYVIGYGEFSRGLVEEFGKKGAHFEDKTELYDFLKNLIKEGDLVLFKGSRGMALEEIADHIMEEV